MSKKIFGKRWVLRSGGHAFRKKTDNHSGKTIDPLNQTNIYRLDSLDKHDERQETMQVPVIGDTQIIEQEKLPTETEESTRTQFDLTRVGSAVKQKFNDLTKTVFFKAVDTQAIPVISEEPEEIYSTKQDRLFSPRTRPKSFTLGVVFTTFSLFLLLVLAIAAAGMGVFFGIAKAYVSTTPPLNLDLIEDLDQTSIIYDVNGNVITTFAGIENRDWAAIDEIPDMLKNAFVAVEDVRFYKHSGVDYKRLLNAVLSTLRNVDSGGGSTITQQLIKNRVLTNEVSYKRKVQEAYLALELEGNYSKNQILEAYLNAIFLGGSNYGVKTAAKDFFGKEMNELTIRECAMIAGLTQNPSRYDPRRNTYEKNDMSKTNERTDTVLRRMYQAGFISKEQYEAAEKETVYIVEKSETQAMYDMPFFVEYAIYNVVTHMMRVENLQDNKTNRALMEHKLKTGGYHIYTTVDPVMQKTVQNEITNWNGYPKLRDPSQAIDYVANADGSVDEVIQPQAASVVVDNKTGEIKAMIGGREEPTRRKLFNRAYQGTMEVGSSIKPLSIYGPALDNGASPGSILLNYAASIEGYGTAEERGYPLGGLKTQGPVTMRTGVRQSLNVVAARTLYEWVTPDVAVQYLENLGINKTRISNTGAGLALGTSTISPLEMAGAFATIANKGMYLEPIAYTKVEDSNGNIVYDAYALREKRQVFKPSSAWMLTSMLEDAVASGTGSPAKIKGMTVAGKTGTNSNYKSVYFAGYTPYYTSALWVGHDKPTVLLTSGATGQKYAAPLWQSYMAKLHVGLQDKPVIEDDPAQLGLVERTVCSISGKLSTDACSGDPYYKPITDWFLLESVPTEYCDMHFTVQVCVSSGKLATQFCPSTRASGMLGIPSDSKLGQIPSDLILATLPNALMNVSKDQMLSGLAGSSYYCPIHTSYESIIPDDQYSQVQAQELVGRASSIIGAYAMTNEQERQIKELMSTISQLSSIGIFDTQMQSYCQTLENLLANVTETTITPTPSEPDISVPDDSQQEQPEDLIPDDPEDYIIAE